MRYLTIIFISGLLLFFPTASAQYYNTGRDPASLKWLQIKTPKFTVIYPATYGQGGPDFARALDDAYLKLTNYFPEKKFRIPVIIHNYTTHSNGYVAWAPRRMEIFPTPEQNTIPVDPNKQLSIHELTHVMQMESLNTGFSRAMSLLLGEQFPGAVAALLPFWYLEGDAVFAESALTGAGRGHSPSFQKGLKAITIRQGKMYKYDKIINGSFRDYVPSHYESGFQMLAWSRIKYDSNLWNKVLDFTGSAPFTLNPVNISLSSNASLTKKRLFRETFDTLTTIWISDDYRSKSESYRTISPPKENEYINYHSPVYTDNNSVIAVKTSLSQPPSFVLINPSDKTEKRIHTPGNLYPWFITYGGGKLSWVETITDPVWENRSWSVVKIMDTEKKKAKKLTRKTRYMSAAVSPDGNYVAVTENTVDNRNYLVVLNSSDGSITGSFPAPDNVYLQRPSWDDQGKKITLIFLKEEGEGIMTFNTTDRSWETFIDAEKNDLQSTYLRNDSLFFISSVSGTDNIWLRKPDKSIHPVTHSRFGVSDINIHGSFILFSDYSSSGNNICYTSIPGTAFETDFHDSNSSYLISRIDTEEIDFNPGPADATYLPVPYRKWQHLFRIHSWMPFYADIEEIQSDPASVKPGFSVMTQNALSTLISSLGYEYSGNRHKLHSRVEWHGWPFSFDSRIDYGEEPVIEKFNRSGEAIGDPVEINPGLEITTRVSLPLRINGGRFIQSLNISASMMNQNNYLYIREQGIYDQWQTNFTGRFYFSNHTRMAIRDIYPKWAQLVDLSYSFSPLDREFYGPIATARTAFYFPGLLPNNGFKVKLEIEKQESELFIRGNRSSFSRSYENIISRKIAFFSADYYLPLVYPDFNISSLLYLTRIRADLFYDFTRGTGNHVLKRTPEGVRRVFHDYSEDFESFGVEIMSDFYLLRMPFIFSAGVQTAWRDFRNLPYLKLLFNINIFGMNIGKTKL